MLEIWVETVKGEHRYVCSVDSYGRARREVDGLTYSRSQAYRRVYVLDAQGREVPVHHEEEELNFDAATAEVRAEVDHPE